MKLEFCAITKGFGSGKNHRKILDCVSAEIEFPHVLAILGPSGGGKSTLLRLVAGLETPDEGSIVLEGIEVPRKEKDLMTYRRTLGVVFQSFNLFPHMSALQNVMLPLTSVHNVGEIEARRRAIEVMERLGIADHQEKLPLQLSGGERQRVAIARALAFRPSFLLFDEPTSALDPEMTAEVLELIAELREDGIPMLLVTHEMGFARKVADQVAFLVKGRIVEHGSASDFFRNPKSESAVRFLEKILAY
jgi:polar amino acid transport system ATP-binding protein